MDGHERTNAANPSTIHEVICGRLQSICCGNINDIVKTAWTDGQAREKDTNGLFRDKTTRTGLPAENTTWTGLPAENTTWTGLPAVKTTWRVCGTR